MAFDQPSDPLRQTADDGQQSQVKTNTSNIDSTSTPPKKEPLSPWEEELPEEVPKEQKIGTFSDIGKTSNLKQIPGESSFKVPENIESQTPLNIVDGNDLVPKESGVQSDEGKKINDIDAVPDSGVRSGAQDISLPHEDSKVDGGGLSNTLAVSQESPALSKQPDGKVEDENIDDLDIFGDNSLSNSKAIAADIKPSMPQSPLVSKTIPNTQATAPLSSSPPSFQEAPSVYPEAVSPLPASVTPSQYTRPDPQLPSVPQRTPAETAKDAQVVGSSPQPLKKGGLLGFLKRRKANQMPELVAESSADLAADQATEKTPILQRLPKPVLIVAGITLFVVTLVSLTEMGALSIGLEKVYNSAGLEILWGGLPNNAEDSLGRALLAMKEKPEFKVKGEIKINVNKSVQSEVTTPLVSYSKNDSFAEVFFKPDKAIFAVTEEDYPIGEDEALDEATIWVDENGDAIDDETTSGETADETSNSTTAATDEETDADLDDSTSDDESDTASEDQELTGSYKEDQADTKDITFQADGFVSKKGSDINLLADKAGTSEIELKNDGGKLWVKSDKIMFNENAEEGKWLEYNISALEGKGLVESFFTGEFGGVTVEGKKTGNQKIGKIRCYNYKIEELVIGDMLSEIGITSDMIQSIDGNIWVGVKDKLIRRLDLKIIPSSSAAINSIELSLELTNFGEVQSFTEPPSPDVITDLAAFVPQEVEESEDETVIEEESADEQVSEPSQTENDGKRKADLALIKKALEAYKDKYAKYPVSSTLTKVNAGANILSQILVPTYIAALPKDPLDAQGWFYGYKSVDGKSYYLSARLENLTDPGIKIVDNLNLYFLYNE